VENLKLVNGISRQGNISNGQTLLVPVNGDESDVEVEFEAFNMHLVDDHGRATRHRVRRGETLSHIARRYHVSVARLRQWNGPLKIIRIGQTIAVAQPASRNSSNSMNNRTKVF